MDRWNCPLDVYSLIDELMKQVGEYIVVNSSFMTTEVLDIEILSNEKIKFYLTYNLEGWGLDVEEYVKNRDPRVIVGVHSK